MSREQPSRLEQEYAEWKGMTIEQLNDLKIEFTNSKNIIQHELDEADYYQDYDEIWYRKAQSAKKIYAFKINTIESLIGQKRENFKFFKKFYFEAKKHLPTQEFDLLLTRAAIEESPNETLLNINE